MNRIIRTMTTLCLGLLITACHSGDDDIVPSQGIPTDMGGTSFYLLNEGNWGSNKSTIDYYDASTQTYHRNIYAEANPGMAGELGDMGNDLQVYDGKLWAVINNSHLVEVMDAATAQHITQLTIPNCRYITFHGRHAYVTSYAGPAGVDPNAQRGYVARIDLDLLTITDTCLVGYQPEQLVICNDHLYVTNSGGYRAPDYDHTVSVIDLERFSVVDTIDVAPNLHLIEQDRHGFLWVTSRGDYGAISPRTYVIDPLTRTVCDSLELAISGMALAGDSLYAYSSVWDYATGESIVGYHLIDTRTREVVSNSFITDATDIRTPYGIAVSPTTREIYVTDAGDYINPGYLHCFTPEGNSKGKVRTGDIPAHIAFVLDQK